MAPRSPPAIMDDVVIEILLRLPPDDDTACLTRASLVCKAWRRLLADRVFLRRYLEVHGSPPFLGFLYNNFSIGVGASGPLFLRTTPPSPFPQPPAATSSVATPTYCRTLDCRHGRVLLYHPADTSCFTVWDPVTGKERCFSSIMHRYGGVQFTAAVLCASNGCDHLDCSGGLFHVVVVAKTHPDPPYPGAWYRPPAVNTARASLYSSEAGKWTVSATIDLHSSFSIETAPSLLAGDEIFFAIASGKGIFKYDLTRGVLSVINLPPHHAPKNMILCTAEDGGLGVAAMDGSSLRLLSGGTDPDGIWRWAQERVMELDSMIPTGFGDPLTNKFYVVGFAEGTGYIFVRVNDDIFRVELKSGRMSKIGSGKFGPIFPFMRFGHLPGLAGARHGCKCQQ